MKVLKVLFLLSLIILSASCTKENTPAFQEIIATTPVATNSEEFINNTSTKEEISVNREGQKVIKSWDEFEASDTPLISAVPDKEIFLYAIKPKGMVLYIDGKKHYYAWSGLTPRFTLPRMYVGDFDSNGEDELAVILYVGSGTGVSVEELHLIDLKNFNEYIFEPQNYLSQLDNIVKSETHESLGVLYADIRINEKLYSSSLISNDIKGDENVNRKPIFGNIVRYKVNNNRIKAEFAIGVNIISNATPFFIGNVSSDVIFKEYKFLLENSEFVSENRVP